jgi:hypothetical protein
MSDIKVISNGASGVKVDYALPSTIDTQDAWCRWTCTPAPGKRSPVGTTTVTCTAKDSAGNTRTNTFDVIVTRKQAGRP